MIEFHFEDVIVPGFNPELFISALDKLVESEGKTTGDINVIFCSDEYLLDMNRRHLEHDYYTDIITFDYCEGEIVSGDLFVSTDRVNENAGELGVDSFIELARVCAHGVLHLCGYKDKTEQDASIMRSMEEKYLPLFCST